MSERVALRTWEDPADTGAVQGLAQRLWPRGPHPGGLGWEAAIEQLPASTVLAEQEGTLVGWAGVDGGALTVHADPDVPGVARALLGWAITESGTGARSLPVADGDQPLAAAAAAEGFALDGGAGPVVGMFLPAPAPAAVVPSGYRIRPMADGEDAARVEVHRAAWRPKTMPWPGDVAAGISPDATSRFTAAHFARVRRTWLYDQELDLVVEGPDGLVACCTLWWAPELGCAEIEPLGVVPAHRRRRLAGALCRHAAGLVAARGGTSVFINTGPRHDYPAPAATYLTVGFSVVPRGRALRRAP